jgi:ribosomal protein S18 acetylase RimI-like enzyme
VTSGAMSDPTAPDETAPRVRVVAAAPDDWARMRALRLAALADSPDAFYVTLAEERDRPDAFWRARLANPAVVTLRVEARDGNGPWRDAGLAVLAPSGDDPAVVGLYSVWVAPHARGRGAGDALVAAALTHARERGFRRVALDVGDANAPAIGLYRRAGFRPTGRTSALSPPRAHVTEHELAVDLGG